ncbi:chemotaxis protein CheA [Sediminibacillus massiliensis]|uniref:chemotaxis protein CheA n=1 Tax=Sediminibacillus massiliensis TaxID=1926277 RepID=UPI0009883868|nr:chemotaxis protein CheA [Sediminibacillus massiliensis]
MDTNEYTDIFLDESRDHLQAVNDNLLKLEKQPGELGLVAEIFRSAHTLKGMAATMGFEDIASLTHQMENVLDLIRNSQLEVTTEVIDVTFEATESLEEMVSDIAEGGMGKKDVSHLVNQLVHIEKGTSPGSEAGEIPVETAAVEMKLDEYQSTVILQAKEQGFEALQVKVRLNEDCMLKAARVFMVFEGLEEMGEVLISVPAVEELEEEKFEQEFTVLLLTKETIDTVQARINKVSEVESVEAGVLPDKLDTAEENQANKPEENLEKAEQGKSPQAKQGTSKTIRVNIDRIDYLMNLFEEMVIDRGRLEDLSKQVGNHDLIETVEHMSRVTQDMQSMLLTMRMVPVEQVFNRFPRMVRSLAKDLGKEINLEVYGADTELDRTVVDEIGDPLVHLIRNSIDHGVESPAKRKERGKSESGTLVLNAFHSGNHVFIEIRDDGGGINREKVVEKAISNGLITEERSEKLTNEEVYDLIFAPGFSTADQVSDISGRGVGLDVVRNKIESLGGHINVESAPKQGSKFTIQLPLTLSILSTLLVKVANETYAIPLSSIEETVLLKKSQIMYMKNQPVMDFRGKVIPILSLEEIFKMPAVQTEEEQSNVSVVIVRKGEKMTALVVDSFIGQKEVVLKSLGDFLPNVFAISGATILGDGRVSLIIDPNELIM